MLFTASPPDDSQRRAILDKTLDEWKLQHPHLGVDHVEAIEREGKTHGMNIHFHFSAKTLMPLTVKVQPELAALYGKEFIETVVHWPPPSSHELIWCTSIIKIVRG